MYTFVVSRAFMSGTASLPGTWSHNLFTGIRECPPWCSIVGATVTVHQFFDILYLYDIPFDDMVYQQIVGIPMGTNCAPLIADLFLYCYERDFMSDLQKSKRFDLIDMFNDTSRYLDDIFTIDNPEFEKHISDIYPAELQLNKANTSDKETSFLDLNIKVIGSHIHTSVYDKRDDFGFPIVNFPWLSGDVPRLPS